MSLGLSTFCFFFFFFRLAFSLSLFANRSGEKKITGTTDYSLTGTERGGLDNGHVVWLGFYDIGLKRRQMGALWVGLGFITERSAWRVQC